TPGTLQSFSWTQAPTLGGDVLGVMFVTIINFLLNTTGIELSTRTDANIDRDLKVLGFANIVTAALGGYVSCTSLSRSLLVRTAGGSGRLSGLTAAAVSAALLIAGPAFVGYVPKYILGGLLFFLGGGLIYQWLIQSARQLQLIDYLSLIAIALLILNWGFIAGVDSAATQSFAQIKQAATEAGARIVLVKLSPELERAFRSARFVSDDIVVASDLDRALESCEQAIIEAHRAQVTDSRSLRAWLSEALGDAHLADWLAEYCRRLEVQPGDVIARQGDPATSMHFILEGR